MYTGNYREVYQSAGISPCLNACERAIQPSRPCLRRKAAGITLHTFTVSSVSLSVSHFLCLCATGLQAATAFYFTHAHKRLSSATPVTCPNPHNPFGGSRRERIPTHASTMEANGGRALSDKIKRHKAHPQSSKCLEDSAAPICQ